MSPWGKFFLENVGWYPNGKFESWRMTWTIERVGANWGWRVAEHLDVIESYLRR